MTAEVAAVDPRGPPPEAEGAAAQSLVGDHGVWEFLCKGTVSWGGSARKGGDS